MEYERIHVSDVTDASCDICGEPFIHGYCLAITYCEVTVYTHVKCIVGQALEGALGDSLRLKIDVDYYIDDYGDFEIDAEMNTGW
jgi:hypothetical protein